MKNKDFFIVDYSEVPFKGMKTKQFNKKESAESWIEENKNTLYWKQIRFSKPKSKHSAPQIPDDSDFSKYTKIEGNLDTFFETGMECLGLILDDHSIVGPPNPNFDPNKPESDSNFQNFSSYENIHFIESGDVIQVEGYPKIGMLKDREFAAEDCYRLSFYPKGFDREEWVNLFSKKRKATLWRLKKST